MKPQCDRCGAKDWMRNEAWWDVNGEKDLLLLCDLCKELFVKMIQDFPIYANKVQETISDVDSNPA